MTSYTHHPHVSVADGWTFDPTRTYKQKPWRKPTGLPEGVPLAVDESRCLVLHTADDIDRFHTGYVERHQTWRLTVDWEPLARRYAGLIITPYIWQRRLDGDASSWYYGWDCASGCIWDLSAVREVSVIS